MCVVFIFEHVHDKKNLKCTRMEKTCSNILILQRSRSYTCCLTSWFRNLAKNRFSWVSLPNSDLFFIRVFNIVTATWTGKALLQYKFQSTKGRVPCQQKNIVTAGKVVKIESLYKNLWSFVLHKTWKLLLFLVFRGNEN